jgi:hypothetical protein
MESLTESSSNTEQQSCWWLQQGIKLTRILLWWRRNDQMQYWAEPLRLSPLLHGHKEVHRWRPLLKAPSDPLLNPTKLRLSILTEVE